MFPMETAAYQILKDEGVDGLTIYQETYNRDLYKKVHLSGKKADYDSFVEFEKIDVDVLYDEMKEFTSAIKIFIETN